MSDEADIQIRDPANRTLWVLSKDGRTITCLAVGAPGHEELRVFVDRELYLTELHKVHDGLIGRAETLHRGFEAHGWTPVAPPASPP